MAYKPAHRFFRIVIPRNGTLGIDDRSAIVTREPLRAEFGRLTVYYEGNRYGNQALNTFAERLLHAAGRDSENYPTVAKSALLPDDLIDVGRYDLATRQIIVTNPVALDSWLQGEVIPPGELEPRYVIYSAAQAKDNDGDGYWSNIDGWGYLDSATVFTQSQYERFQLPTIGVPDAAWLAIADLDLTEHWVVQHEKDDEDTFVIQQGTPQDICFSAEIPWRRRLDAARRLASYLNEQVVIPPAP